MPKCPHCTHSERGLFKLNGVHWQLLFRRGPYRRRHALHHHFCATKQRVAADQRLCRHHVARQLDLGLSRHCGRDIALRRRLLQRQHPPLRQYQRHSQHVVLWRVNIVRFQFHSLSRHRLHYRLRFVSPHHSDHLHSIHCRLGLHHRLFQFVTHRPLHQQHHSLDTVSIDMVIGHNVSSHHHFRNRIRFCYFPFFLSMITDR